MNKYIKGLIILSIFSVICLMHFTSYASQTGYTESSSNITVRVIQRASGLSGVFNFPNPFNPKSSSSDENKTTIVYVLTENSKVTINIYNCVGDLVRKLEYESGASGGTGVSGGYTNRVTWDGRNGDGMVVANGIYIAQIIAEPASGGDTVKEIRKIAVVK